MFFLHLLANLARFVKPTAWAPAQLSLRFLILKYLKSSNLMLKTREM